MTHIKANITYRSLNCPSISQ